MMATIPSVEEQDWRCGCNRATLALTPEKE